jgi:hypothetical protein
MMASDVTVTEMLNDSTGAVACISTFRPAIEEDMA